MFLFVRVLPLISVFEMRTLVTSDKPAAAPQVEGH
jgi:hypothetical protein